MVELKKKNKWHVWILRPGQGDAKNGKILSWRCGKCDLIRKATYPHTPVPECYCYSDPLLVEALDLNSPEDQEKGVYSEEQTSAIAPQVPVIVSQ